MPNWVLAIAGIAAVRFLIAMALFLSGHPAGVTLPLPTSVYAIFASLFAVTGGFLLSSYERDRRAGWLGGVFLLLTVPISPTTLTAYPVTAWLVHMRADSMLPFFIWRFVDVFPSRIEDGVAARLARAAAGLSALIGAAAFLVNASFAIAPSVDLATDPRALLAAGPRIPQSWYWLSILVPMIAAFSYLLWKAVTISATERRRVFFFVGALLAGLLPVVVQVVIEQASPAYRRFSHSTYVEPLIGIVLFAPMGSLPLTMAYSVLFDRIVELRFVLRLTYQYVLARYSLVAFTLTPFIALTVFVWDRRGDTVASFLVGSRPLALAAAVGVGIAALRMRETWLHRLNLRYFREPYNTREVIARLVSGFQVDSLDELTAVLQRELNMAMHVRVDVFYADEMDATLRHSEGRHAPLSTQSMLVSLAMSGADAMDVDLRTHPTLSRLPPAEIEWLQQGDFRWLVCLRIGSGRCAGLVVLSNKRSEQSYSADDRVLLNTVAAAAGLALDNLRLRSSRRLTPEPPAGECMNCARVVDGALHRCTSCGGAVGPSQVPLVLRGTYRLIMRIGAGGMGIVYRASDLLLARDVAIKTLPAVTPEHAARLRDEARAMAAVSHPNLAVAYGIEMWNDKPLLIVEYLAGGTLRDRLSHRPLTLTEAIDVGIILAEVLDELHRSGIVHCDIKPSNIGFTKTGSLKLLDFGLARLISVIDPTAATMTIGGHRPDQTAVSHHGVAGTPYYMAPEAVRGDGPTMAFDLWAVAVVVYETMTGKRPFEGREPWQVFASVAKGTFAPVEAGSSSQAQAVNEWLHRELSLDPTARSRDAAALASSLRVLRGSIG